MRHRRRQTTHVVTFVLLVVFVVLYPVLISIYIFLPLFMGVFGLLLIRGFENGRWKTILLSLFYFFNLDVNLSLPFFVDITAVFSVYLLTSPLWKHIRYCHMCRVLFTVFAIDAVYFGLLNLYDFVFATDTVAPDKILLYPLIMDLLVAAVLL